MPTPSRFRAIRIALVVALFARPVLAQARIVSAPDEPSLLNLTASWARASTLGDLRDLRVAGDYLELRVWHGYGPAETQATVLQRANGRWSAWFARVIRCELAMPPGVGDTASGATIRGYVAEARRNCGKPVTDVAPGARLIAADTLVVEHLDIPEASIEAAWKAAESAGVLELPGRAKRDAPVDAAATFLIEVRRGNQYRASEIEDLEPPPTKTDAQVRQIYAAVRALRP
jgi:hypothetical protein